MKFKILVTVLGMVLLSSCAKRFYSINPSSLNFENRLSATGPIRVNYIYDVQFSEHNKKYSKHERKTDLKLLAVKVENTSDHPVTIDGKNFHIKTASGRMIPVVEHSYYTSRVRQKVENYILFYGISGISVSYQNDTYAGEKVSVYYNPIPLLIGIGNAIFAGVANGNHKRQVEDLYIIGKTIPPNSYVDGVVAIKERGFPELIFEYSADDQ